MATTTVNHINVELAAEVAREIATINESLKASAERPSQKYFNAGLDFGAYVASTDGITFLLRLKLKHSFKKKDASSRTRNILDTTPECHFHPGVREILNDYWDATYKN